MKSSTNRNFYSAQSMPNSPCINLILGCNNSLNFASPQFPQYVQNTIPQSIPTNSTTLNLPTYPNYPNPIIQQQMPQFFQQQPQFNQQPNLSYYGLPTPTIEKKIRKKNRKKINPKRKNHTKKKVHQSKKVGQNQEL